MKLLALAIREDKEKLMKDWDLTEFQWNRLIDLVVKKTWVQFHSIGNHPSFGKRDYFEAISEVIDGHGAECFYPQMPNVHYVNMGDTYATTIIMQDDNKLYVGCWADVVENNPQKFID